MVIIKFIFLFIVNMFLLISSPFHKILVLLLNVFMLMFLLSLYLKSSWVMVMFLMLMVSGLMVLFIYMASLYKEVKFMELKFMLVLVQFIYLKLSWLTVKLTDIFWSISDKKYLLMSLNTDYLLALLMYLIYILNTLTISLSKMSSFKGSFRSKF